jgi:hypothetical protein
MSRRAAFAFIALIALAMFARPLVRNEVLTFRDHSDYFQPLRYFTAVELRNFRLPLWNPYNASGEPWLANPQTAVFYPPFWIYLLVPFAQAYVIFLLLHIALLGCGAFLLFSRFASERAAFVGAVALMLCGPTLSMLDIQNNLTTFAWIPVVLWCALSGAPPVLSGSAIAMSFLAGEPFFASVGALLFLLAARRSPLAYLIDTAVTAFCLAGVVLIPFLAMIAGSDRAGATTAAEILRDSMPLADWFRVAVPGVMTHQLFVPIVYIGIVPSILAIVGAASSIRTRAARPWLVLLVATIVIAAGQYLPPVGALLAHLPLTILRYPARVVPIGAFALIALAVIGFDRAFARFAKFVSVPLAVVLIIADLVPHIAPLLHSAPFDVHAVPYSLNIGRDGKIIRLSEPERAFDRRAWIAGYLNLFERRFDAWTASPVVAQSYIQAYETAVRRRDVLDGMSIAYILEATPRGVVAKHNLEAFPLAFFRDDGGRLFRPAALAFTTSAVFVILDAPSDGTVIVTQREAPGWSVEIDQRDASAQRIGIFRGVRVTRGHHEVVWRYHPRSFAIGIALTILAIARMLLSKKFVKRMWPQKNFAGDEKLA